MPKPVYVAMARLIGAMDNCDKSGNTLWYSKHEERLEGIVSRYLPSGSGWDSGTSIDIAGSSPNRIILLGGFHHMDENGFYDGWTEHQVIITPDLQFGFNLRITGLNQNDIKDHLYELFDDALRQDIGETES